MLAGAANLYHTRRVSAAELALLQAKLPRNSSQIARGRIRRFESYMPSQAVQSPPSHNGDIKRAVHGDEATREAAMAAFAKSWRCE